MNNFPPEWQNMKVILAHDWLTGMRGGERVLEVLCRAFPQAPIYTLFYNPGAVSEVISRHSIKTSWLQNIPGILKYYRNFLPFFPSAMESMQTEPADLVISTSHCVAKGLIAPAGARHFCYCFTPMRYAWVFYDEYFGNNSLKKALLAPVLSRLRHWDKKSAARVDCFTTLSGHVQKRIRDFYNRDAAVVYPPVDLSFWTPELVSLPKAATFSPAGRDPALSWVNSLACHANGVVPPELSGRTGSPALPADNVVAGSHLENLRGNYDLIVSALVPYKRIDLAVRAYNRLGYPLKIAGTGTEAGKLIVAAGENIEFLGRVTDERLLDLYRHCRMLIFPGEDDFGIVPVEAQACGKPVVAFARGGVLETTVRDVTGVLFEEQNEEALLEAVRQCALRRWDPAAIRKNAERFSEQNFIDGLSACIRFTMGKNKFQFNDNSIIKARS